MQRIMIVGQPGSGKSTLARALGETTGLPVVHIDHIHWLPGWVAQTTDEKTRLCHDAEAKDAWIFEGGHSATWQNRLARADMLIWLDLPLGLRFWRILWRTIRFNGRTRPDLPDNCPEGFHAGTLPFWRYVWDTRLSGRQHILRFWDQVPPGKARARLASVRAVRQFLRDWPQAPGMR